MAWIKLIPYRRKYWQSHKLGNLGPNGAFHTIQHFKLILNWRLWYGIAILLSYTLLLLCVQTCILHAC